MKIRGTTISTPLKPEAALVKCKNLTEEQQAQVRTNIGADVLVVVLKENGTVANFSAEDIFHHARKGGSVLLSHDLGYIPLSYANEECAKFERCDYEDNVRTVYEIYNDATVVGFVDSLASTAYVDRVVKEAEKTAIDKCCPPFTESGSVVTCAPVEGYPLGVVSKIEPVQEGEGDPSPSITGDSVVLDVSVDDESTAWIYPEGLQAFTTYKLTINTSVAPASISVYNVESGDSLLEDSNEFSAVFTTKDATDVRIVMNWDRPKPAHEEGITPYIVQPYTPGNIRPITGHTAVKLWRGGKNLLKMTAESQTINGVAFTVNTDGTVTANGTATSEVFFKCGTVRYPRLDVEYQISGSPQGGGNKKWMVYAGTGYDYFNDGRYTPTVKLNTVFIYIASGQTMTNAVFKPMLRIAGTSAVYEPYRGDEFTADLGQTVYGGSYDWTSGVLTVNKAFLTLNGETEFKFNNVTGNISQFYYKFPTVAERAVVGEACMCSHYVGSAEDAYNGKIDKTITAGGSNLWICDSSFSSAKEFNDYLKEQYANGTPVQVAYSLKTPVTVHLTPQTPQEMLALSGTNTLYSDTGDTQVSGRADPNAVIEKLTNAIIALGGNV